ncbi:MAG: hypothetical protein R6X25_12350 [Candidatus Krumholzibacteriia bacterium]
MRRKRIENPAALAVLIGLVAAAGGCAGRAELEPAPSAETMAGGAGAVDRVAGIHVSAVPAEWPGPVDIAEEVTPLRLRIENDGSAPLLVRYENFALIAPGGERSSALPPFEVEGEAARDLGAAPATPVADPAFVYDRFAVAPYYRGYYPGFSVAADPFYHDPLYFGLYRDYWVDIALPTERMLQLALPEGRLEPGGSLDGWVYFERVDPDLERVRLRVDLVDARSGRTIGEATMPFRVKS